MAAGVLAEQSESAAGSIPWWQVVSWASGASAAVETISVVQHLRSPAGLPGYYTNTKFWIARAFVIGCAGGLAVAFHAPDPLLAIHVGAATPGILSLMSPPDH